jgi:hypothetical protein
LTILEAIGSTILEAIFKSTIVKAIGWIMYQTIGRLDHFPGHRAARSFSRPSGGSIISQANRRLDRPLGGSTIFQAIGLTDHLPAHRLDW